VVLGENPPVFVGSSAELLLPRLTLGTEGLVSVAESDPEPLPLAVIGPSGSPRKLKSYLEVTTEGESSFTLLVKEPLYGCPRCSAILPHGDFDHHRPIGSPGSPPCVKVKRAYRAYGDGRRLPVRLFARSDPDQIAAGITGLVWALAAGGDVDVPPQAEPWLEELEAAFDDDPHREATDWLITLPVLTRKVRNVADRDYGEASELMKLGEQVRRSRSGLRVFWRWLKEEVG